MSQVVGGKSSGSRELLTDMLCGREPRCVSVCRLHVIAYVQS